MSETPQSASPFLLRFRSVWSRLRWVQLAQIVVCTLLVSLAGWGLVAWADYEWELGRPQRMAGLVAVGLAASLFALRSLWRIVRRWSQPATAAQIEEAFPELGQSVRTTVQFGRLNDEQVQSEGVASTLVTALATQTDERTRSLGLDVIVPTRKLWVATGALGALAVALLGAVGVDWQWRNASNRALLNEKPYTELTVAPGNVTVDESKSAEILIRLIGRTDREVLLQTRLAGQPDAEWLERELRPAESREGSAADTSVDPEPTLPVASADRPRVQYSLKLEKLTKELEYRAIAGDLMSPIYRIDIRRPLKLAEVRVQLTPPEYTGQAMSTVLDPNLSVLQGTRADFVVTFEKPVKSAALVFAPRKQLRDEDEPNAPEIIPLVPAQSGSRSAADSVSTTVDEGKSLNPPESQRAAAQSVTATLALNEDRNYSIVAEAADGTRLPDNKYRIRVQEDQPPQVSFESPDDAVEVHTLAELPMRVRVRDDYGLSRAGIIFQINNEQEIPLASQDFQTVAAAAQEAAATGRVSPTTQAVLERLLPLEYFELTQKDSVMYFAFAEDNRPDQHQRTETDMRFIDIRPFKREYRVIDPDPMNGMGMGLGLKSLEELIQRQRFALNRTIQFEKRAAAGRKPDATSLDQLMKFETDLAQSTRDTALGLEARGFDDTELLYQAEAAMLQAVDSLSVGKWENATLQMRDALKFLVEQRDRSIEFIRKNPDRAQLAALRAFDRLQAQKLRRPKTDKEEARELIRRLQELASQETAVSEALAETGSEEQPKTLP